MSDLERRVTRRGFAAGLMGIALVKCDAAQAAEPVFAERFVTFEPAVPLAPIAMIDRHGRPALLAPHIGRSSLIVLWATWCPACHRDVPLLAAARRSLMAEGIDVALVNVDKDPLADVLARAADIASSIEPSLFDPGGGHLAMPLPDGRRSPLQLFAMPILFVVDRAGLVRGYVTGAVAWTDPAVLAFFRAYGH